MLWGLAFRSWEPHHIILIIRWQWITRSGAASLEAGFDNSYLVCDSWRHTEENFNLPKNMILFSFIKRKIIMSDEWCIWYRVLPWQLIHVIRIRANVIRTGLLYDTKSGHKDPDLCAPCQSEELVRGAEERREESVCSLEKGGRGRQEMPRPSPRLTRSRGRGGILIDTLQNLELHSFLTQDAFPHLNSTGAGRGNLNI